jgi:hypothetical protein
VAPAHPVQELAHVIAMVSHPESALDKIGNPLRSPQFRPVAVSHGSLRQETDKSLFLSRCQPGRPARRRLGPERILTARLQGIAPAKDATRVATHASGNLMKG